MASALLVVLALASVAAAQGATSSLCAWYSYAPVDEAGYCHTNKDFYLTIPAEPTTFIAKALTRVYARAYLCSGHKNAAACAKDARIGCAWNTQECVSEDLAEWTWYQNHPYLEMAPAYLLCPGSQAQRAKVCLDLSGDRKACSAKPGCGWNKGEDICQADFLLKFSPKQRDSWATKFAALDKAVHGACESVCYLRKQLGGRANSLYESDPWSQAAAKADQACASRNGKPSAKGCKSYTGGKSQLSVVNLKRVEAYKNWVQSTKPFKCSA